MPINLSLPLVVAIPAKDEAEHIVACLAALDGQIGARFTDIVLFVNNSRDATASLARGLGLRDGTRLHVIEQMLPAGEANAGSARRHAMTRAAAIAAGQGYLFTTDADAEVDPDWLGAMLACFAAGADAVAGWVELDPIDWGRIPRQLHEDDARECAYDALCDEIHALLDPDPADPWPRHTQHSGASIGVAAGAYARCGGVPAVACGEDRALIDALRRIDATVRHAPEVHVVVSGRTEGRSDGGMADTIRRRMIAPDTHLDARLEPARSCALRARARGMARRLWRVAGADVGGLARLLRLPEGAVARSLCAPSFGMAREGLEAAAPALVRQSVAVSRLDVEMQAAQRILLRLRGDAMAARPLALET